MIVALYDTPVKRYLKTYARDSIPKNYSDGQTRSTPSDKNDLNSAFEADTVILQLFWPAYLTNKRIAKTTKRSTGAFFYRRRPMDQKKLCNSSFQMKRLLEPFKKYVFD